MNRAVSVGGEWRSYPDNKSGITPGVAARDAVRLGDHREAADAYLLEAAFSTGHAERANALKAADICATLCLRDAIEEATVALRETARTGLRKVA